jgi:hypothetical protein
LHRLAEAFNELCPALIHLLVHHSAAGRRMDAPFRLAKTTCDLTLQALAIV